ncbi:MAG: aldehyde dehydrogenase family protein [Leucobacter sp.]
MADTSLERIPDIVTGLRYGFDKGITRPESWRREQLQRLRAVLLDRTPEIEAALHADLGKSGAEAQATELGFLAAEIDHALAHLGRWMRPRRAPLPPALLPGSARVVREPLGVALIIAPWNYPVLLALSPLIGAIAAGNAAIVKPSELAPATSAVLARALEHGLDRRAFAVVEGGVPQTTVLLKERFDHIFYTGSGRVGRIVARAAAEHLTPITLELGGKSPVYVDGTVDIDRAAKRIAWGKFINAGQTCVAPDYVLGTGEVLAQLGPALVTAIHDLYGSAIERNPDYGRIVTDAQFERLVGYLEDGEQVTGGGSNAATRFIEPTVLAGVSRDAPVMRDEIFGPILPLVEVDDLNDALSFVRGRDKPLAAYVFTADQLVRERWELDTSSGGLGFGAPVLHLVAPDLPFGGVGASGMGAYHGERSFLTFTHEKAVLTKPLVPETLSSTVMPPFTPRKEALLRGWMRRLL